MEKSMEFNTIDRVKIIERFCKVDIDSCDDFDIAVHDKISEFLELKSITSLFLSNENDAVYSIKDIFKAGMAASKNGVEQFVLLYDPVDGCEYAALFNGTEAQLIEAITNHLNDDSTYRSDGKEYILESLNKLIKAELLLSDYDWIRQRGKR